MGRGEVDVQVFERVSDDAPMYQLNLSEIGVETVSSKDIETVITDGAGTVVAIVMGDVTGEGWIWGAVKGASVVKEERPIGDVAAAFGLSRNAVSQIKTRVERMIAAIEAEYGE